MFTPPTILFKAEDQSGNTDHDMTGLRDQPAFLHFNVVDYAYHLATALWRSYRRSRPQPTESTPPRISNDALRVDTLEDCVERTPAMQV